jgi:hypothetical protein
MQRNAGQMIKVGAANLRFQQPLTNAISDPSSEQLWHDGGECCGQITVIATIQCDEGEEPPVNAEAISRMMNPIFASGPWRLDESIDFARAGFSWSLCMHIAMPFPNGTMIHGSLRARIQQTHTFSARDHRRRLQPRRLQQNSSSRTSQQSNKNFQPRPNQQLTMAILRRLATLCIVCGAQAKVKDAAKPTAAKSHPPAKAPENAPATVPATSAAKAKAKNVPIDRSLDARFAEALAEFPESQTEATKIYNPGLVDRLDFDKRVDAAIALVREPLDADTDTVPAAIYNVSSEALLAAVQDGMVRATNVLDEIESQAAGTVPLTSAAQEQAIAADGPAAAAPTPEEGDPVAERPPAGEVRHQAHAADVAATEAGNAPLEATSHTAEGNEAVQAITHPTPLAAAAPSSEAQPCAEAQAAQATTQPTLLSATAPSSEAQPCVEVAQATTEPVALVATDPSSEAQPCVEAARATAQPDVLVPTAPSSEIQPCVDAAQVAATTPPEVPEGKLVVVAESLPIEKDSHGNPLPIGLSTALRSHTDPSYIADDGAIVGIQERIEDLISLNEEVKSFKIFTRSADSEIPDLGDADLYHVPEGMLRFVDSQIWKPNTDQEIESLALLAGPETPANLIDTAIVFKQYGCNTRCEVTGGFCETQTWNKKHIKGMMHHHPRGVGKGSTGCTPFGPCGHNQDSFFSTIDINTHMCLDRTFGRFVGIVVVHDAVLAGEQRGAAMFDCFRVTDPTAAGGPRCTLDAKVKIGDGVTGWEVYVEPGWANLHPPVPTPLAPVEIYQTKMELGLAIDNLVFGVCKDLYDTAREHWHGVLTRVNSESRRLAKPRWAYIQKEEKAMYAPLLKVLNDYFNCKDKELCMLGREFLNMPVKYHMPTVRDSLRICSHNGLYSGGERPPFTNCVIIMISGTMAVCGGA